MKKASRLLAAGAVAGGVLAETLSVGKRKLSPRAKRGAFAAAGKVPRCARDDSGRRPYHLLTSTTTRPRISPLRIFGASVIRSERPASLTVLSSLSSGRSVPR